MALARTIEQRSVIKLLQPHTRGGLPLFDALKARKSTRKYSGRGLEPQQLSDLLWAAFGINRPDGDRTAPYWKHVMVTDIYVAMPNGVWVYEPQAHELIAYDVAADIRGQTGLQDFVATAALDLIYVAHGDRMTDISEEERTLYASVDAGFIGQNVYLFCASEGLGTVFRGGLDAAQLGHTLGLPEGQFVTFAQTVGYAQA